MANLKDIINSMVRVYAHTRAHIARLYTRAHSPDIPGRQTRQVRGGSNTRLT